MGKYYDWKFRFAGPKYACAKAVRRLVKTNKFDYVEPARGEPNVWYASSPRWVEGIEGIFEKAALSGVSSEITRCTTDGFVESLAVRYRPGKPSQGLLLPDAYVQEYHVARAWLSASRGKKKALRVVADALAATDPIQDLVYCVESLVRPLVEGAYLPSLSEVPVFRRHASLLAGQDEGWSETWEAGCRSLGLGFLALLEAAEVSNEMPEAAKTAKRTL